VAEEKIDCDLNLTRNMNVFLNEADAERARRTYEAICSKGLAYTTDIHYTAQRDAEKVCLYLVFPILKVGMWS
jgi:hypothetical protein